MDFFKGLHSSVNAHLIYGGNENQKRTEVEVIGWISIDSIF